MIRNGIVLTSILFLLTGCGTSSSLSREEKAEKSNSDLNELYSLLEQGPFIFQAQTANPMGMKTIQLTTTYTLEEKGGIIKAHLPYFGRAYQADLTGPGGIEFRGEPKDLALNKNERKRSVEMSFTVDGKNDTYESNLVISSNGYGTLTVLSRDRQSISFYGQVTKMPDDYVF